MSSDDIDQEEVVKAEDDESESDEESDHEFSDPEGFVDDITDEELLADLMKDRPVEDTSLNTVIVVDNAPKIGPERMGKLKSVLNKVFGKFGKIKTEFYPVNENGLFKGYFFLEYSTAEEAANAVQACDGYKLDKSHVFAVNLFTDFEKYDAIPEVFEEPQKFEYVDRGDLRSWLRQEDAFDQYAAVFGTGNLGAICFNTPQECRIVCERERWTETYLQWSPLGTYLATFHSQGVALWGGDQFDRLARFAHTGVRVVDFSPCEKYLVTFSSVVDNPNDPQHVVVWDIATGEKKRTFPKLSDDEWPILKWSFDGKYFARKTKGLLSVYETPSFGMLEKKSLVVEGIRDFVWSPTDNLIAYWVPELQDIPSKIFITRIPSRDEVATKSRHLVSDCKLHWHKQGDFLCAQVDFFLTKSKKQLCSSIEVFHMRQTDIPVDAKEIKEPVIALAMEPVGSKFAIIHGEPPTRISASFYKTGDKGAPATKINTLEKIMANHIFWCPTGQFVVLAGLKSMDGVLDFIDTNDMTVMNRQEHTKVTDISWDPTGRYVVSSVSFWSEKIDSGFIMWSFQGKLLYRSPRTMERFCQLVWRPRPPSLLTEDNIKSIKADFKKYQYKYEQKDRTLKTKASKELLERRRKLMEDFNTLRQRKLKEVEQKRLKYMEYLRDVEEVQAAEAQLEEVAMQQEVKVEKVDD